MRRGFRNFANASRPCAGSRESSSSMGLRYTSELGCAVRGVRESVAAVRLQDGEVPADLRGLGSRGIELEVALEVRDRSVAIVRLGSGLAAVTPGIRGPGVEL